MPYFRCQLKIGLLFKCSNGLGNFTFIETAQSELPPVIRQFMPYMISGMILLRCTVGLPSKAQPKGSLVGGYIYHEVFCCCKDTEQFRLRVKLLELVENQAN